MDYIIYNLKKTLVCLLIFCLHLLRLTHNSLYGLFIWNIGVKNGREVTSEFRSVPQGKKTLNQLLH